MDINEPSLMDVAHDTINSTQGPALIEVAYFPSSEGKGQGFFRGNSGRVSFRSKGLRIPNPPHQPRTA
ncbi:hypothetical protein AXX17_ATUG03150 (mitochondrion) [Arabidopsis thaliana]|jgi:hypothetical protein|uniref:Uncharacterized protein n=1 Tax=Arabidopsis thaliana TaxID=3702 RepID=A0A178U7P9_ARATH|nr:hypothetical protein AXX17_ATUG03150 [Arabidopsis thaliana]